MILRKMNIVRKFKTGNIPSTANSVIVIDEGEGPVVYSLDWKVLIKFEFGAFVSFISDNTLIMINQKNECHFYSLGSFSIVKEIKSGLDRGNFIDENSYLIQNTNENILALLNLDTEKLLWSKSLLFEEKLTMFAVFGTKIIATPSQRQKKYCFNLEDGNLDWVLLPSDLNIPVRCNSLGNTYLVDNVLIGHSEDMCWFGIDINTKAQLWDCKQPAKSLGGALSHGVFHSISIYEFETSEEQEFVYIGMDCLTGEIKREVNISKRLRELNVLKKEKYGMYDYFNAISVGQTHLFFAVDQVLMTLDLSTCDLEIVYEHEHKISSSKIHNQQIFVSDNSFNLLLLKGDQLIHDVLTQ
tara:strand:- start:25 stop:1089 length:1065 start_codon:yes stop_codon:yes gene_type:complete